MMKRSVFTAWLGPQGNDQGPGTVHVPFRTFRRARSWLEQRRSEDPAADVVICFQDGTYRLSEPISLQARHCGRNGGRTVIRGESRSSVTLTGSEPVKSRPLGDPSMERRDSGEQPRVCIDVPERAGVPLDLGSVGFLRAVPHAPPMVFQDDLRLQIACWPEAPTLSGRVVEVRRSTTAPVPGEALRQDDVTIELDQELSIGHSPESLWFEATVGKAWCWYRSPVIRLSAAERRVTIRLPAGRAEERQQIALGQFHNARIGLSRPGRMVFEASSRQAILSPLESHAAGASRLELCVNPAPLIHIEDGRNIELADLALRGGLASGIVLSRCDNVQVRNCDLQHFGFAGVEACGERVEVAECTIRHVGRAGIYLRSGDDTTLRSGNSAVRSCVIENWAEWIKAYEPAVRVFGTGSTISECSISDGPHMAIEVTGNDHTISRCSFTRVTTALEDMGVIYLNQGEHPLRRGIEIVDNLFQDIGHARPETHAVYVDRASYGVTVRRNLFLGAGDQQIESAAIRANGSSDLLVENNVFIDCPTVLALDFYLNAWGIAVDLESMRSAWKRTIEALSDPSLAHHQRYPELAFFSSENRIFPPSNAVIGNAIVSMDGKCDPSAFLRVRFASDGGVDVRNNAVVAASWLSALLNPGGQDDSVDGLTGAHDVLSAAAKRWPFILDRLKR